MQQGTQKPSRPARLFVKGAWLYTLEKELSEDEFIERAGGLDMIKQLLDEQSGFPFFTVVFDDPNNLHYLGHMDGRTIAMQLRNRGYRQYQTMQRRRTYICRKN